MTAQRTSIVALVLLCAAAASSRAADVKLARVPDAGIQPQVVAGGGRTIHLIYLTGKPNRADVNYARSDDGGATWGKPLRVNAPDAAAIATGTMRGPHVAVSPGSDTVHVAWMASPKSMMYARLRRGGAQFESPRNLVTNHPGLDGGGSVAAGADGLIYVAWHAPATKPDGDEADRRVYLRISTDDGRTFSDERAIFDRPTGACGCCGMRVFADGGDVFCVYRGAADMTRRGLFLLASHDDGQSFSGGELAPMTLGVCLMSTNAFAASRDGPLVAWETLGRISWSRITRGRGTAVDRAIAATGDGTAQKHPSLAVSPARGDVLLAWTEGTRFGKGGTLAWQVYDSKGNAAGAVGRADGVPAHSVPAALCNDQGDFIILY